MQIIYSLSLSHSLVFVVFMILIEGKTELSPPEFERTVMRNMYNYVGGTDEKESQGS